MITDRREMHAVALSAGVLAAYVLFVLASGKVNPPAFAILTSTYIGASMSLWAFVGLFGLLLLMVRHARGPLDAERTSPLVLIARFIRERWQRDYGLSLIWSPLLFALLMASFNAFKQMILIDAGFDLDPLFAHIDHALFLGHDPWTVTHAVLRWPLATYIIDNAYHGWFAPMSLGLIVCAWGSPKSFYLRTQYTLTYIGVWIVIGSAFAYLLPAAGPCFYAAFGHGPMFQPLLDRLAQDQAAIAKMIPGASLGSLTIQHGLLRLYGSQNLAIGGGISAMPSVHNALAALFALGSFRINRIFGRIMAGYAVLIWIGSIDLGWHYAVDGIVSVSMTVVMWRIAGRIAARLERPLLAPVNRPIAAT